jgi:putative membrane protein
MIALHVGFGSIGTSWAIDPIALIGLPLAALLYARGLRNLGPRKRYHATWRPWAFYGGLATLAVALLGPMDHLSDELFYVHMSQHLMLTLIGAPLVLLGAPMLPILRGIPRRMRRKLFIPVAKSLPVRAALRTITLPLVAWMLFVFVFALWHVPAFFEAALDNEALHLLEHLVFAGLGYGFWWNVIDPLPLRPNLSYLVRVPYIFITVVPTFILGAFLTFSDAGWYGRYELTAPLYGLTGLDDQQIGGVIMWIGGSFIIGTALMIDLYMAVSQEQRIQLALEQGQGQRP